MTLIAVIAFAVLLSHFTNETDDQVAERRANNHTPSVSETAHELAVRAL